MHFVLQTPTLQHLAGVKIVAHLWTQRNIMNEIKLSSIPSLCGIDKDEHVPKKWMEIVKSQVSTLPLPELCNKQLLNIVEPIGTELIAWGHFHNGNTNNFHILDWLLGNKLFWTMHGTVDYVKTAQLIVKDERIDVGNRYEFACMNYLEDEARELFESMGEGRRQECVNTVRSMRRGDQPYQLICFTCSLTGDMHRLESFFQSAHLRNASVNRVVLEYALSVCYGYGAMGEYWFSKLRQREKDQVLEECQMDILRQSRASSLIYYLSQMNEEQQESMFRECTKPLLKRLLGWPMQSLFMKTATCRWQLMNSQDCSAVLFALIRKISDGANDYDYAQLFWECWRLTTAEYKRHFLGSSNHLECLFLTKRKEFIQLVFTQASWYHLKELVEDRYDKISPVMMDESVFSDAALMGCKETAAFNSLIKNQPDLQARLRSNHLKRLIVMAMKSREMTV